MGTRLLVQVRWPEPFESADVYCDGKLIDGVTGEQKGTSLRCVLKFKTSANEVIHVKTGISGVSVEAAAANVAAEAPGWDFDGVRSADHAAWRREMGRIQVTSDDPKYLEIFYTGLYHMMVAPSAMKT